MIGPDDPPPYTAINDQGKAKVLLTGDHVSNAMPKAMNNLGLDKCALQQHIAYDIGTRKLIHHLSDHLDAPAVLAGYSRLVVDLNRSLEDPSVMPETSDERVIPGNQSISETHRNERIHCFYTPYAFTHPIEKPSIRSCIASGRMGWCPHSFRYIASHPKWPVLCAPGMQEFYGTKIHAFRCH